MNFLTIVNSVLRRLREAEVSTVYESEYSKLVCEFINDIKHEIEDAYTWNALTNTLTADTAVDLFSYALTGSGNRFRIMDVINDTSNCFMRMAPSEAFNNWFLNGSPAHGAPIYYNFNGVDSNGDSLVDLFPVPDGVYNIRFNLYIPQEDLVNDTDVPKIPTRALILGAYARCLVERGEDAGLSTGEAYMLYQKSLADAIALEDSRFLENHDWESV